MARAVKKIISLPRDLASEVKTLARNAGKTLSAIIRDALRPARQERLKGEFRGTQGYWAKQAKGQGDTDGEKTSKDIFGLECS